MTNDKTVYRPDSAGASTRIVSPIEASYTLADGRQGSQRFFTAFRIGRQADCDLYLDAEVVSRQHAEVYYDGETWWIRDLDSTNGLYVHGKRVQQVPLSGRTAVQLGGDGPVIHLEAGGAAHSVATHRPETPTEFVQRYLDPHRDGAGGEHSILVRQAFAKVGGRQRRKFLILLSGVLLLLGASVGVVVYQQLRLERMQALAVDIFYGMKEVELQVAGLSQALQSRGDAGETAVLRERRRQLEAMRGQYDEFLDQLGIFSSELSESDRLILRMARIFGECELDAPPDFTDEVERYIEKWRTTRRFERSVQRAEAKGYAEVIYRAMVDKHLPPQFFYLALKESGLRDRAVGPPTRFGIAKGAWQFIPDTALRYGLKTGPLVEVEKFDPRDERHDFEKSTRAAARYLSDIYTTEAQASGLLVMASYNWGENNVRRLIRQLPENPKERNFWQLLKQHKIPQQTYDYVMYIFAAAVIGENPRLFGFDLDNPLGSLQPSQEHGPWP